MKKILLISLLLPTPLFAQDWELNPDTISPEEFYMQDTVLIRPTEYPGLPKHIGVFLEREWNVMIPQVSAAIRYDLPRPHNELRGNFDGNGIDDWVVMFCGDDFAGHVLFIDGIILKKKYGDKNYLLNVIYYDEDSPVFNDYGSFYWYLKVATPTQLNSYKYDTQDMEGDYKKWVETDIPFKHSGFNHIPYNIYEYNEIFYFNEGKLGTIHR